MSKGQTLRALVNERLVTAAEDIFVLFERTIAEYEEELCRSKEENQRKQQLLDKVLSPRFELVRENVQISSTSPGPGLNQEITETPQIKEEQGVKQEEEQLPVSVPESSAVCVKTEESSLLQQRQTEHRKETQGEDISSEPHFHSETEGYTDDDWGPSFSWSAAQMETEAEGTHYNQDQIRDRSSKPETTAYNEDVSGTERKKHQCPFCKKTCVRKRELQIHIRVHTGEKPYSCLTCKKHFADPAGLRKHRRIHTGEKPFSCTICKKHFADSASLRKHRRIHTGEKPFSCTICKQHFADQSNLIRHKKIHTGTKPHICTICDKAYTQKGDLYIHLRSHTGETPFS